MPALVFQIYTLILHVINILFLTVLKQFYILTQRNYVTYFIIICQMSPS